MATERESQAYSDGERAAWTRMLRQCIEGLGLKGDELKLHALIVERERTIAVLRELCSQHGDNNWDESLHLADILDGHLRRHLG